MSDRLYRPPDWEDIKPKFSVELYTDTILNAECEPLGVTKAVYDKGVEDGADAGIRAVFTVVEKTLISPFNELHEKHGHRDVVK